MLLTESLVSIDNQPGQTKKNRFKELLLSTLDFDTDKKKQISRHYWHSFPAKFPPDLPKFFISNLTAPGNSILDPMAGSCTALIEAVNLNRRAYGFDIDPLSLTLGKAKLQNINTEIARNEASKVVENAYSIFQNNKSLLIENLKDRFDAETLRFLDYWFLEETQLELLSLIQQIEIVKDKNIQEFLTLIFSGAIITKSGGVTLARDLAHTRPHRVVTKKPVSAFTEFSKRIKKYLDSYIHLPSISLLQQGDAKKVHLKSGTVDLVITSPPYANNAIDYMRAHKFSLVWLGYKISELKQTRKQYIGSETVDKNPLILLPEYAQNIVDKLYLINKNKGKALHRYFSEMLLCMKEMFRVLKHNRGCVIVVATSILNGLDVKTHICLSEIGKAIGFELVDIGERNIHRDSRMLPTSFKKNNSSQIEARMHNEYVIGFWKA